MTIIQWDESMNVGIEGIDADHKGLVEILNKLYDALIRKESKEVMCNVLGTLVDHTIEHFKFEEECFEKMDYPDAEKHKVEHRGLVDRIIDIQEQHNNGELLISVELLDFFKDWLVDHIQGSDMSFGAFYNKTSVA